MQSVCRETNSPSDTRTISSSIILRTNSSRSHPVLKHTKVDQPMMMMMMVVVVVVMMMVVMVMMMLQ